MGTFGHNAPRDNWFWSDGNLDNQAWDNALAVAATGRITQLTAYMAGDTGAMVGGPALWDAAGSLLLYNAISIARRSAPYSGGFDGTGRNPNDGYYINAYGFSHTFTNPTSFIIGAFRRSSDSWILGFDDHESNYGHLKTTSSSSPVGATGGNSWSSQTGGYNGGVQAYGTYTPLGMFSRVAGVWKPVTGKKFIDTTTTYRDVVLADAPLHYHRIDEATTGPYLDLGSLGSDGANDHGGPSSSIAALIVDPDTAGEFAVGAGGIQASAASPGDVHGVLGPVSQSFEFWIKVRSASWDNAGVGGFGPVINAETYGGGGANGISAGSYNSHFGMDDGIHKGDALRVVLSTALWGAGLEDGFDLTFANAMTGGYGVTHHVAVTYDAGSFPAGSGFSVGTGVLKVYVDGTLFTTVTVDAFQPQMMGTDGLGHSWSYYIGTLFDNSNRDFDIDEAAWYGYVLSPTQVAHHHAVGTGATGGTTSVAATYYVRNDSNTAWIALNMAALRQEMPWKREFPVRRVFPDGTYEDLLGRWMEDEPRVFGRNAAKLWDRAKSGLFVPRGAYRLRSSTA